MQRAAAVIADQVAREAAAVAEQIAREAPIIVAEEAGQQSEFVKASGDGDPVMMECADDTTELDIMPVAFVTMDEDAVPVDENEEAIRFKEQCEAMASAIDVEKGVEEVNQPWLGHGEEWVTRTPEVSGEDIE